MILITNTQHRILEKSSQIWNEKEYYTIKVSDNEGSYQKYNCNKLVFNTVEEGKAYYLFLNHKTYFDKDNNKVTQRITVTEAYSYKNN